MIDALRFVTEKLENQRSRSVQEEFIIGKEKNSKIVLVTDTKGKLW